MSQEDPPPQRTGRTNKLAFALLGLLTCVRVTADAPPVHVASFTEQFVHVAPPSVTLPLAQCTQPAHDFEISQYEVTNTAYASFLNAVASQGDPHHLYSPLQTSHFWGGILRAQEGDRYRYSVKPGYEKLPVTFVSWMDAARFINWLHFGRPSGRQTLGVTEGSDQLGAYNTVGPAVPISRNPSATYFLPTCGEWVVAGFYDPRQHALTRYVGGNSIPTSGPPQRATRSSNYYEGRWALPYPHLAPVDAYPNNRSALGTFNQSANAQEWVETSGEAGKLALGGSVFLPADTLTASYRDSEIATKKVSSFGFRVARVSPVTPALKPLSFEAPVAPAAPLHGAADKDQLPRNTHVDNWVRISRPGNWSDPETGVGCVPYEYEMASTELTNAQYAEFLNAVAREEDRYSLFKIDMQTGTVGGLIREGKAGQYHYTVKAGFADRPVTYMSWFSLARYANWLHYGRPAGKQTLGITEGDDRQGAYDTRAFEAYQRAASPVAHHALFVRNAGAQYFIPTDDEWYKAAYYDPERPGLRKYWSYPNRSDSPPPGDLTGANYQTDNMGEGPPYYVSRVGAFRAHGYYPIVDMGGNVWEWTESWRNMAHEACWRCDLPTKGLRGGSFNYIEVGLSNHNIDPGAPGDHYFVYGARLARRTASPAANQGWCVPSEVRRKVVSALPGWQRWTSPMGLTTVGAAASASLGGMLYWLRRRHQRVGRQSA